MSRSDPIQRAYSAFLAPWNPVLFSSASVIGMRVTMLPWLWLSNPDAAKRESQKMVSEKEDAWQDWQRLAWQAPMNYWLDVMKASFSGNPARILERAASRSGRRLAKPYASRVNANRRRLGRG